MDIYNPIFPIWIIKKSIIGFAYVAMHVDNLNLVETLKELTKIIDYL